MSSRAANASGLILMNILSFWFGCFVQFERLAIVMSILRTQPERRVLPCSAALRSFIMRGMFYRGVRIDDDLSPSETEAETRIVDAMYDRCSIDRATGQDLDNLAELLGPRCKRGSKEHDDVYRARLKKLAYIL